MEKLEVLKFPDPRLRSKGDPVKEVTPELVKLAKNMLELMYAKKGVGLAAIQVNKKIRLLVADTSSELSLQEGEGYDSSRLKQELVPQIKQPLILFNPEVVQKSGSVVFPEGCLSFPSYYADVKRAEVVEVKALNEKGEPVSIRTDGLLSICLQHEIDHLDGKLFLDHLSPFKAQKLREDIKKHGYPNADKTFNNKANKTGQ